MTIARRSSRFVTLLTFVACFWIGTEAKAARFAVLVGNDEGIGGDPRLRFSESDTAQLAELLVRLGGFARERTSILLARTAGDLRLTLADLTARLRSTPGDHLVLIYYSGHADAQSLHLGSSLFPLPQLRDAVEALPASTRVLVLDACQSGVLTVPKGGHPGPGFDVELGKGEIKGLAILAASSGSELAQESDQLRASVFTHFLQLGLSGLADRNRDGNVSLGEVFDYTADHTLAATMGTTTGPQHPTFRVDLSGRDDLILTRPGMAGPGYGRLRLDVPGWYFVRRSDGAIAAEIITNGEDSVALAVGQYEITRREQDALDVATVMVGDGAAATVSGAPTHVVAFGRMVRKGQGPTVAYGMALSTAVRSSIENLGISAGAGLVGRVDLRKVSFELRFGAGWAEQASDHLSSTTRELSLAGAALRAWDAGQLARGAGLSFAFGVELGVAHLTQSLDDGERRDTWNPFVGPVALAEVTWGRRWFLRADLAVPVYALQVQAAETATTTAWRPALSGALGVGASF